jgi:hypothetical protein
MKYQGPINSVTVYRSTNGQYLRGMNNTFRFSAIGSKIAAPIATLPRTTTAGEISSTATFKNR